MGYFVFITFQVILAGCLLLKPNSSCTVTTFQISSDEGELELIDQFGRRSWRFGEVRDGCLILYKVENERKIFDFRIPLCNLNLKSDPAHPKQFNLSKRGQSCPIAVFQIPDGQDSIRWLKTLAVQIIINTPLNAVKFLDVLDVNEVLEKKQNAGSDKSKYQFGECCPKRKENDKSIVNRDEPEKNSNEPKFRLFAETDVNHNLKIPEENSPLKENFPPFVFHYDTKRRTSLQPDLTKYLTTPKANKYTKRYFRTEELPDVVRDLPYTPSSFESMPCNLNDLNAMMYEEESRQHLLVNLLTRCQTDNQYVPVSEKRVLFESLSRFSYSVDNLIRRNSNAERKNAAKPKYHSLHDLNNVNVTSVKDMCRYFERTGPSSWLGKQVK